MLAYPCRFEPAGRWDPEDVGFVVTCRDVPEVTTQGDSMEEAMAMAADALAVALSGRKGPGEWPRPSLPEPGEVVVALPPLLAAKVALWASMNEAGVSNSELARRLGVTEGVVRRLLNFRHRSQIGQLEAALAALGKRLVVDVHDAA